MNHSPICPCLFGYFLGRPSLEFGGFSHHNIVLGLGQCPCPLDLRIMLHWQLILKQEPILLLYAYSFRFCHCKEKGDDIALFFKKI